MEQAVIDSIRDFEKIAGLEETLRCIRLIPSLDPERLLSALVMNGNGFLYQKTGYILEALNDGLHLPDSFSTSASGTSPAAKVSHAGALAG